MGFYLLVNGTQSPLHKIWDMDTKPKDCAGFLQALYLCPYPQIYVLQLGLRYGRIYRMNGLDNTAFMPFLSMD